jgi:lysophospholipase L1-like esterase
MMKWNNYIFEKKAVSMGNIEISKGKRIFKNNLTNIAMIARANDVKVILGVQAACFEKKHRFPYIKKEDFGEYNDIVKQVGEEQGIAVVDCFSEMGQYPVYFKDMVHYTERGVDKLSEVFYHKILELYPAAQ